MNTRYTKTFEVLILLHCKIGYQKNHIELLYDHLYQMIKNDGCSILDLFLLINHQISLNYMFFFGLGSHEKLDHNF